MTSTITPQQYIAWVQRSLNRMLSTAMVTNGADTPEYQEKVREFKDVFELGKSAVFGSREQNVLIKRNHGVHDYVTWARAALEKAGYGTGGSSSGSMDRGTKAAIMKFQEDYEKLVDDGWIGAKTETLLIEQSGIFPPGHVKDPSDEPDEPKEVTTEVTVRGHVPAFAQKGRTCWAAAFAMMGGWKWKYKTVDAVLNEAGAVYAKKFNRGQSLTEGQTAKLAALLGLTGERELPDNWAGKLSEHGPLMLVQHVPEEDWLHWVVVTGYRKTFVFSDRSLDREELQYKETGNGSTWPFQPLSEVAGSAKSAGAVHSRWYHF